MKRSYQITLVFESEEIEARELAQRVVGIAYTTSLVEAWRLDEMVPGRGPATVAAEVESKRAER